jgi:hypothetical protein
MGSGKRGCCNFSLKLLDAIKILKCTFSNIFYKNFCRYLPLSRNKLSRFRSVHPSLIFSSDITSEEHKFTTDMVFGLG